MILYFGFVQNTATSRPYWWQFPFMDINKYEKNSDFNRNEAIYVLHKIDKLAHEEIASRFQLALEEIQKIITLHEKYEAAILGVNE
jgi:hypothetical protein